jgi:hypothetical protein
VRSQGELLSIISGRLTDLGISHMVVGSLASSFHGEPRQTRDIDIVVEPDAGRLSRFQEQLDSSEFYSDAAALGEAIERQSSFNIIDVNSGWKVDILVRRDRPFSDLELSRRGAVELLGSKTFVASPEDTIITKLEWAAQGDSERQLRDVIGIVAAQDDALDAAYIDHWVGELGLRATWDEVLDRMHGAD